MIRSNLATRPFYNEQAVQFWLGALVLLVVAATVLNVSYVLYYSRSDSELAASAVRDEARAAELRSSALRLRESVDSKQLELSSLELREANQLIDRRTFSWTELFNQFETAFPPNVRITSVRPRIESDGRINLRIGLRARDVRDVESLMENLETTGAFVDVLTPEERMNDEGQLEVALEAVFAPQSSTAPETEQGAAPADSQVSGGLRP